MELNTSSTIFGQRSSTDTGSTDELKLSSFTDIAVTIPSTVPDAERLLHFVRSHRDVCEIEKNLAIKHLHQTLLYLQLLRDEIDRAGSKLSAADDDLVKVKAAIRMTGLWGVRFGPIESSSDRYLCCEAVTE
ncbi:hypothetical protein C8J57DRAFT_1513258 [Mycena rebaudengoi]|nr:hypothetical protein C8J57DRAFT_1513258 [Mycena rebaudengoi]